MRNPVWSRTHCFSVSRPSTCGVLLPGRADPEPGLGGLEGCLRVQQDLVALLPDRLVLLRRRFFIMIDLIDPIFTVLLKFLLPYLPLMFVHWLVGRLDGWLVGRSVKISVRVAGSYFSMLLSPFGALVLLSINDITYI